MNITSLVRMYFPMFNSIELHRYCVTSITLLPKNKLSLVLFVFIALV
jgi:hypothetical protein